MVGLVKVYVCENLREDRELIKKVLGEGCIITWAREDVFTIIDEGKWDVVLDDIRKAQPDCMIVDLALNAGQEEALEQETGKEYPFAELSIDKFGGGFLLIEQVLKQKVLQWDRVFIFTQYPADAMLSELAKKWYSYSIQVLQKRDEEDSYRLSKLVFGAKGIRVKYMYSLISEGDSTVRENIVKDLESVGEQLRIKWFTTSRTSLREAEENFAEDKKKPFDLVFMDLSLDPQDDAKFTEIRDQYMPELTEDSFTAIRFARRMKQARKSSTLVFLSELEKRSLVAWLLSPEVEGDWVVKKNTLTKSLVALLIKLFVADAA